MDDDIFEGELKKKVEYEPKGYRQELAAELQNKLDSKEITLDEYMDKLREIYPGEIPERFETFIQERLGEHELAPSAEEIEMMKDWVREEQFKTQESLGSYINTNWTFLSPDQVQEYAQTIWTEGKQPAPEPALAVREAPEKTEKELRDEYEKARDEEYARKKFIEDQDKEIKKDFPSRIEEARQKADLESEKAREREAKAKAPGVGKRVLAGLAQTPVAIAKIAKTYDRPPYYMRPRATKVVVSDTRKKEAGPQLRKIMPAQQQPLVTSVPAEQIFKVGQAPRQEGTYAVQRPTTVRSFQTPVPMDILPVAPPVTNGRLGIQQQDIIQSIVGVKRKAAYTEAVRGEAPIHITVEDEKPSKVLAGRKVYCTHCNMKVIPENPYQYTSAKRMAMLQGTCPICGHKVSGIIGKSTKPKGTRAPLVAGVMRA